MPNTINTFLPNDYTTEAQRIAELLRQAQMQEDLSLQPTQDQSQMIQSGPFSYYAPDGGAGLKALAKGLRGHTAEKLRKEAMTANAGLATKQSTDAQSWFDQLQPREGSAAGSPIGPNPVDDNGTPMTLDTAIPGESPAASQARQRSLVMRGATSANPYISRAAAPLYARMLEQGKDIKLGKDDKVMRPGGMFGEGGLTEVASNKAPVEVQSVQRNVLNPVTGKEDTLVMYKDGTSKWAGVTGSMTPDAKARLGWDQFQHGSPSMTDLLGAQGRNVGFGQAAAAQRDTGIQGGPTGVPLPQYRPPMGQPGMPPQGAPGQMPPQQGQMPPQGAPMAPPRPQVPTMPQNPPMAPPAPSGMAPGQPQMSPANQRALDLKLAEAQQAAKITAQQALPQARIAHDALMRTVDQMIGSDPATLKEGDTVIPPHKGLKQATGFGGQMMSGVSGTDAADFATLYNQVKGGAFLQAFDKLKGGGQITEIEGQKATQSLLRASQAQKPEDFIKAMQEFRQYARQGFELARQKAGGGGGGADGGWKSL